MSLNANWFSGAASPNYTEIRCDADFSAAATYSTISGAYHRILYGPCEWLVFMPDKKNDNTGLNLKDPEYGYVYAVKDSDGSEVGIRNVYHTLRAGPAVSRSTGERLYRPFGNETTATYLRLIFGTGGSDTCSVWLYQPFAWYGRAAQVIAAIMLTKGVDVDYIDTSSFSAADDAEAAMGTADDEEPFVFYRRQINQTLAEAIKSLSVNTWSILSINMNGKIAMVPRNGSPASHTLSGIDRGDGVVSVRMRWAYEHLVNHTWASEGRYYEVSFETVGTFYNIPATCNEISNPSTASDKSGMPFEEFENAASRTKFGDRELGREIDLQEGNEHKVVRQFHLPYNCNINGSDGDPLAAKAVLMSRMEDVDSQLRREVTTVQDLRGLDYDVGYKIEDVALTRDGQTFDAYCIKKTIDFNNLSVTSVLLEEPS